MIDKILICNRCGGNFLPQNNTLICNKCNLTSQYDGHNVFFEDDEYYWGEIPESEMDKILEISRNKGWKNMMKDYFQKTHPRLVNMIMSKGRVDWINLFDSKEKMSILDIGSGWGQNSFLLANNKNYFITSLEKIKKRALFQSIRQSQSNVENMSIVNGDIFNTNFKPNSFNLIIYIGVLEWLGFSKDFNCPRQAQLYALKKNLKYLKSNGHVLIGIENRLGFNNFLGAKDHSGLRFTSLMPRKFANLYMSLRNPKYRSNKKSAKYNTYTYSLKGYIRLLKDAGFSEVDVFVVYPHYAHPRCIIPANNKDVKNFFQYFYRPRSLKDFMMVNIFKLLSFIRLAHIFSPNYIIIGKK